PVRCADGSGGARPAQGFGQFAVAGGASVGNQCQSVPDRALELGSRCRQRQVEPSALAGEVLPQLHLGVGEDGQVVLRCRFDTEGSVLTGGDVIVDLEVEIGQVLVVGVMQIGTM